MYHSDEYISTLAPKHGVKVVSIVDRHEFSGEANASEEWNTKNAGV